MPTVNLVLLSLARLTCGTEKSKDQSRVQIMHFHECKSVLKRLDIFFVRPLLTDVFRY